MRSIIKILAICVVFAMPAGAQQITFDVETVECLPNNDNGVIHATVAPETGGTKTRLYFRWAERGDFYFVDMVATGSGRYWAVPPKPTDDNEIVEYYVAVVDPAGQVLGRSETISAPVNEECEIELTEAQWGASENLIVGETAETQVGERVNGFLCDGVVSRSGPDGVLRVDDICRKCIIAFFPRNEIILPTAIVTGGLITSIVEEEVSPSRP